MSDNYDDLRKQADEPKPESWKPEQAGDEVVGIVAKLDSGWDRDGNDYRVATDRKVSTWWDRQKSGRPAATPADDADYVTLDDGRVMAPPEPYDDEVPF